jgi:hypothetical protein
VKKKVHLLRLLRKELETVAAEMLAETVAAEMTAEAVMATQIKEGHKSPFFLFQSDTSCLFFKVRSNTL